MKAILGLLIVFSGLARAADVQSGLCSKLRLALSENVESLAFVGKFPGMNGSENLKFRGVRSGDIFEMRDWQAEGQNNRYPNLLTPEPVEASIRALEKRLNTPLNYPAKVAFVIKEYLRDPFSADAPNYIRFISAASAISGYNPRHVIESLNKFYLGKGTIEIFEQRESLKNALLARNISNEEADFIISSFQKNRGGYLGTNTKGEGVLPLLILRSDFTGFPPREFELFIEIIVHELVHFRFKAIMARALEGRMPEDSPLRLPKGVTLKEIYQSKNAAYAAIRFLDEIIAYSMSHEGLRDQPNGAKIAEYFQDVLEDYPTTVDPGRELVSKIIFLACKRSKTQLDQLSIASLVLVATKVSSSDIAKIDSDQSLLAEYNRFKSRLITRR